MKLVHLFKIYWPDNAGGIARAMEIVADSFEEWNQEKISEGFSKSRQEIVVCRPKAGMHPQKDKYKQVPVYRCRMLFDFASTPFSPQLLKTAKKRTKNADVILYHFPYPMIDLGLLLGMFHGKLVVWWHCDFATQKGKILTKLYSPLVNHTLKKADAVIVSAKGNTKGSKILEKYKKKCSVIPFAVSDEIAAAGKTYYEAEKKNCVREKVHVLFIGRFVWYKGIDILLKAFSRLDSEKYELVLVGNGPLFDDMRSLADDLNLGNVTFTGSLSEDEKINRIKWSDFLVLPSTSKAEAFAIVQIEAMAFGKPVINTWIPSGVPEVSMNAISGITVEPGNITALYKAMKTMGEYPELRKMYGSEAVRLIEKRYKMSRVSQSYKDFFEKLFETV